MEDCEATELRRTHRRARFVSLKTFQVKKSQRREENEKKKPEVNGLPLARHAPQGFVANAPALRAPLPRAPGGGER